MKIIVLCLCLLIVSCVKVHDLQVVPVTAGPDTVQVVESPVKVHLVDGSTVVFEKGIEIGDGKVLGEGFRYDIRLQGRTAVTEIPLADVAAMESFQTPLNTPATVAASSGATIGGVVLAAAVAFALFGSCPTTYSLQAVEPVLEAESFSYSIAPAFEARDVDRLGLAARTSGYIDLEMRNEALETHYINEVELLSVEHASDEQVITDHKARPLILRDLVPPLVATDNEGRVIAPIVAARDDRSWRASDARLQRVSADDFRDYIDIEFAAPGHDAALVLRLRNSLLNTVLFYDVMLRDQGPQAIDWMGHDLQRLGTRFRTGRWYQENMGMTVSILKEGRYREFAAIPDSGPIAWKEVALRVPRTRGERLRLRLSFVADNWRVDQLALATLVDRGKAETVGLSAVIDADGVLHAEALSNLADDDDSYVITRPGEHLRLRFDAGEPPAGRSRTFFIAATGYYMEWLRGDWLQTAASREPFRPGDAALVEALNRWQDQRENYRERFDATRINIR